MQLGITYGNLGKYEEFAGLIELIPTMLVMISSLFPFIFGFGSSTLLEIRESWIKFRLSTPVSAVRLVLAKYTVMLISITAGGVISAVGLSLLSLFGNNEVTAQNIKIGLTIGLFMFILGKIMEIAMLIFRSQDKAGLFMLCVMGVMLAALYTGMFKDISDNKHITYDTIAPKLAEVFPIVVIITLAVIVIGFVSTVMIFKRRER